MANAPTVANVACHNSVENQDISEVPIVAHNATPLMSPQAFNRPGGTLCEEVNQLNAQQQACDRRHGRCMTPDSSVFKLSSQLPARPHYLAPETAATPSILGSGAKWIRDVDLFFSSLGSLKVCSHYTGTRWQQRRSS